jgi:polyisoprenoid-binding protein YceI
MKRIAFLALTAAISTSVFAAPESYTIDNAHTYPRFSYNHLGYSTQLSRFDKTVGTIKIDSAAKTGAVNVTIEPHQSIQACHCLMSIFEVQIF